MSGILTTFYALLLLSVLVLVHELGHFLVGRMCKMGIEEFSVGFGPRLFGVTRGGTAYNIRAIPLGGYVRFEDELESSDSPTAFTNVHISKRIATILAGPVMNFVFAYLMTLVLLTFLGVWNTAPIVNNVVEGQPAAIAGIVSGDTIVEINGEAISRDTDGTYLMQTRLKENGDDKAMEIIVENAGQRRAVYLTPLIDDGRTVIGVWLTEVQIPMSFTKALPYAFDVQVRILGMMGDFLKNLFTRGEGAGDVMGPVGTIQVIREQSGQGVGAILQLMIMISLNLGLMNLLPLPALDGGRLVFLVIEAIRRKPIEREKEGMVHLVGMAALMLLAVVLTWRDIIRIIQ